MSPTISDAAAVRRAPRAIPVRRPTFDFSRVTLPHWFAGDPFLSHLVNAMSLTFPEGERFFMDAVKHYADRITAPALKREVSRFLGQEALHSRAHEAYNQWLRTTGIDASGIERQVAEWSARVREKRSHRYQLAMTCALEHFTAIMAELLLESPDMQECMDAEVRRLLVWHAIEEAEHKAVAFDVYEATGGTYRTRAVAMFFTTFGFILSTALFQAALTRQDPDAGGLRRTATGLGKMWVSPGWFRRLVPAYFDYYRRDFHPWDRPLPGGFEAAKAALASDVIRA
jgi:predicted metal-dependent hydrolase